MKRKSGILLAVTSLPSSHGVGDFGPAAYKFIDLLAKHKQKMWQILPLNPMGYGNSPYQPYGSKPFDELYISLELLQKISYYQNESVNFSLNLFVLTIKRFVHLKKDI